MKQKTYDTKEVQEANNIYIDPSLSTWELEKRHNENKKQLDSRIKKLFEVAQDNLVKYGKDDYRTEMMMDFLYIADEIRGIIGFADSAQTMFSFLGSAINTIDGVLSLNTSIIQNSSKNKYGFFERRKMKKEMKECIKANCNKMTAMMNQITMLVDMTTGISQSMKSAMEKIKNKISKHREKMQKKQLKKTGTTAVDNSREDVFNKLAGEFGAAKVSETKTNDTTTSADSSSSNGGSSTSASGIDDIV